MADLKISELPTGSAIDGTEDVPAAQSGTTIRKTINQIRDYILGFASTIKSAYESNADTNAYTDAEVAKVGFISVTQAVNLDTMESDIATNNAKVSNVSTALSAGTVTDTTYGITSDGGADDIVLPQAVASTSSGVMSGTDKAKLDGIEAGADVTDTTNVTAAGALMDSEVDANLKTFVLPASTTISAFGATLVDDADAATARATIDTYSTTEINNLVVGLFDDKGNYNAATNTPDLDTSPSGIKKGDVYTTSVAGVFFTESLEIGDVLRALQDDPISLADWAITQTNLDAPSIKALYESNADTNAFTDSRKLKVDYITITQAVDLDTLESDVATNNAKVSNVSTALSAGTVTDTTYGITSDGGADDIVLPQAVASTSSGVMSGTDKAKLDGIEAGATADQTGAEIKSAYEGEANTNAYTDADAAKVGFISVTQAVDLDTMESDIATNNAKVSNVSTSLSAGTVTDTTYGITSDGGADDIVLPQAVASTSSGVMSGTDKAKLDGIEAGADVTDTTNVTAAGALMDSEVDADIKTLSLPANTTISAFGATLVDDADAATARTTLSVPELLSTAETGGRINIIPFLTAPATPVNNTCWFRFEGGQMFVELRYGGATYSTEMGAL